MTSFTSATLGEIRPPLNILKEFLATFNRRQKCKAAILSWLDGKHYYGNYWVRITFENLNFGPSKSKWLRIQKNLKNMS